MTKPFYFWLSLKLALFGFVFRYPKPSKIIKISINPYCYWISGILPILTLALFFQLRFFSDRINPINMDSCVNKRFFLIKFYISLSSCYPVSRILFVNYYTNESVYRPENSKIISNTRRFSICHRRCPELSRRRNTVMD